MSLTNKLRAFTFAELAMVLLIIGVISMLTVPALRKHVQRSEFERGAQKAYFTLNECFDQAVNLYGPAYKWESGKATEYLTEQLKLQNNGLTRDNMKYDISCGDEECEFSVDINGPNRLPNVEGKDVFKFALTFSKRDPKDNPTELLDGGIKIDITDKIRPLDTAKELMNNNWKFTDDLWDK